MDINIQIDNQDGTDIVKYSGPINEESEIHLSQLLGKLSNNCIFNFKDVEYVNSCGVRAWINFMREAEKGRTIKFRECTPEIVMQINMIPSFKGNATIESVYGSYACNQCGHEELHLFETDRNLPKNENDALPDVKCKKCGVVMELEELEEEFFAFSFVS